MGAVIVGAALVVHEKGDGARRTASELQTSAVLKALADAGIDRAAVDGLLTAAPPPSQCVPQFNLLVLDELKLTPRYTAQVGAHCAGALGSLQVAAALVSSRYCKFVVCSAGDANYWSDRVKVAADDLADPLFEAPYGVTAPSLYAQMACRYMAEYHITNEQFARVAVENRRWAVDHPSAMYRDRGLLTVDDVLSSPMVATPLHLYDCAPWFPGGIAGAVVICDEEVAAGMEVDPIYLLGFGQCTTHRNLSGRLEVSGRALFFCDPSLTTTGISAAAQQAYAMCGLQPKDIDIIESSGPFSSFLLRALEELGFCGPGEAGAMVEAGGIDRYGGLPFNTFGGMLSYGQTAQAMYPLFEAVEQLRGTAENRQVEACQVALVHGHGGPMNSQSVLIISNHTA